MKTPEAYLRRLAYFEDMQAAISKGATLMNAKRGLHRRVEALEERVRTRQPERSTEARERMFAHLDQVARLRRGQLSEEEAAEVEATNAAIKRRRMREIRGEGGR